MNNSSPPTIYYSAESVEAAWIVNSRTDPVDFRYYMTGGGKPCALHHVLWLSRMVDPTIERLNLIAPRESAKTITSEYFLAWYIGHFPYLTNYIVSATRDQAKARLKNIRDIIQSDRYKNVFPHIHIDTKKSNKEDEFSVWSSIYKGKEVTYNNWVNMLQSFHDAKDATLFATGINSGKVVGRRCSGICLLDDLHDKDNSSSEHQRQKVINAYLSEIEGTVTESGRVISISTRWAETDFPGFIKDLKDDETGELIWTTIDIPAINAKGESYWGEWWSLKKLRKKRATVGEIWFSCMYLNNPYALSGGMFTADMLRKGLPDPLPPEFFSLVIAIDLATSENKRADYTVMAALAIDKFNPFNMYVLEIKRGRWNITKTAKRIASFYDNVRNTYGRCEKILVEKQGFQPAIIDLLKQQYPDIPFHKVNIKNIPKPDRIEALATIAQQSRLYINLNDPNYPALVSELIGYLNSAHDDIPDCLSLPLHWGEWRPNFKIRSKHKEIKVGSI